VRHIATILQDSERSAFARKVIALSFRMESCEAASTMQVRHKIFKAKRFWAKLLKKPNPDQPKPKGRIILRQNDFTIILPKNHSAFWNFLHDRTCKRSISISSTFAFGLIVLPEIVLPSNMCLNSYEDSSIMKPPALAQSYPPINICKACNYSKFLLNYSHHFCWMRVRYKHSRFFAAQGLC